MVVEAAGRLVWSESDGCKVEGRFRAEWGEVEERKKRFLEGIVEGVVEE